MAPAAVTNPYASVHSERYWPPPGGVALEVPGLSRWKSVRAPSDVEISLRLISVSQSSCHRVARSTLKLPCESFMRRLPSPLFIEPLLSTRRADREGLTEDCSMP